MAHVCNKCRKRKQWAKWWSRPVYTGSQMYGWMWLCWDDELSLKILQCFQVLRNRYKAPVFETVTEKSAGNKETLLTSALSPNFFGVCVSTRSGYQSLFCSTTGRWQQSHPNLLHFKLGKHFNGKTEKLAVNSITQWNLTITISCVGSKHNVLARLIVNARLVLRDSIV